MPTESAIFIRKFPDAHAFRDRMGPWLAAREAENNLTLALLDRLLAGGHPCKEPFLLASVERNGEVVGHAYRTPPHLLVLGGMPPEALAPLVDAVAGLYADLPKVFGPAPEAARFAELWCARRGCRAEVAHRLRIHALGKADFPPDPAPGSARLAEAGEAPLLGRWADAFAAEIGAGPETPGRLESLIRNASLWVWEHGGLRAMAAAVGRTPNGARLGLVYTPPEYRGRGYATAVTAAASDALLKAGRRHVFLFTDIGNPTPNAIYARIGYRPVADRVEMEFHPGKG